MTCRGCGACCIGLIVEVDPCLDDVPVLLTKIDRYGALVMRERSHEDGRTRCIALTKQGECSIYEGRPKVGRDFEQGGAHCLIQIGTADRRAA